MKHNISVIILSYNNFETTTGPCLESLFMDTDNESFEIIAVDNSSQDSTPEMLKKYSSERANIRLILNKKNRGFPGGNNDGVKEAKGDIVILLNSDTVVPRGVIKKLGLHMENNPDWGMLGPITNAAGNEQKIYISEENVEKAIVEGEKFCAHARNDCFQSERLDFFCVAIRRDIYNDLGGLDEHFGLGYYEDLDFSHRARQAGIKMMVAEDCFIFHSAGNTFSDIGRKNVKKLMHENKKKLKKKYSGKVEFLHLRNMNINRMKSYIEMKQGLPHECFPGIDYRFNNRMTLAKGIYPHSYLKKVLYYMQLRNLSTEYSDI